MNLLPKDIIYLDNNATTAIAPEVMEAMLPFLKDFWGNPSSAYRFGSQVRAAIETAREQVAQIIGAAPREILFTSCATESDNAAILSALETTGRQKIVTTQVEHSAIVKMGDFLKKKGFEVVRLPVQSDGTLAPETVDKAVDEKTAICSIMWANNETGVLFPVEEIAAICKSKGVLFHTDAVQAVGKIPIDMKQNKIDMLSIAGHKLHAPKGIGAIYIRKGVAFSPMVIGGGQERSKRGGTENVSHIVGLGKACELASNRIEEENTRIRALRDRLENHVLSTISHTWVNGSRKMRLPNTTSLGFDFIESEAVLTMLDHYSICASSGSACTTGSLDPSHVLLAMGIPPARARGSVRFSLSTYNTDSDIDKTIAVLPAIIQKLRAISPLGPENA
ncbi:MAG: cysteine desulfurase NifS [Verrucomicrobiae bacterium]|nr:cysteine desulfurase NifS [Verrucomicrobiae bacterium]